MAVDAKDYRIAKVVRSEGGQLILICNACGFLISEDGQYEDREHYCALCMSGKCQTKFKAR